ncbi:Membrane-bound lytic murein transglycosylase D precursor [Cedecea davisae]|uniref:Transglycosylase SLT domain protein n=1 Tax=Cedecea davisae DSM 4568 TaxID=566551 RepID=S3J639_9ENTR|nr:lytic transglycosylase domain-containing protein [Cedecea davisae]EPF20111.1 transglycosylase SLT domain protein [Cedecea davisae DSM 4568]SUX36261.1 Membrane-bound lytic murein transglycosylase D precursor [Cedecea davisae]
MIIQELAYKVTIKADEFLNGKKKVENEVGKLDKELARADRERQKELKKRREEMEKFGNSAVSAFRNVGTAAAGFLGIGAGLYGIKQLFTSTANEIVRASQQAKFFGSDVNKMFGVRRGFQQAGLNGDAFIGASGNARMALANIKDPTIFGGLTGAAQNLLTIGARTGININQLGDPNKALSELTRYGKGHSQENLMQVMAALSFDPTDAAKIKSGELKSLVDSETKKSNITAAQVKEQENLVATLGQLDSEFARLRTDLTAAFAPEVIDGMKAFGKWISEHQGDIVGFFTDAGDKVKAFTDAVGGATKALEIIGSAYAGYKIGGVPGAIVGAVVNPITDAVSDAISGTNIGDLMNNTGIDFTPGKPWFYSRKPSEEPDQHAQSGRKRMSQGRMDDLLNGIMMTESGGNPLAYNAKSGAAGAYQFLPGTARDVGLRVDSQVDERLDPEKARAAASIYMSQLLKRYDGNVDNALRAYNWGMGNVDKWIANGSDPAALPKETREYTGKVHGNMGDARNYYATQGRMADNRPYQLSSSGGNPQITNSTHINTVNVNSNPQSVDALTASIQKQSQRASTNASFSSGLTP